MLIKHVHCAFEWFQRQIDFPSQTEPVPNTKAFFAGSTLHGCRAWRIRGSIGTLITVAFLLLRSSKPALCLVPCPDESIFLSLTLVSALYTTLLYLRPIIGTLPQLARVPHRTISDTGDFGSASIESPLGTRAGCHCTHTLYPITSRTVTILSPPMSPKTNSAPCMLKFARRTNI